MRAVSGIPVPDGTDLSSASALRMFAESVDAKLQVMEGKLKKALYPPCCLVFMSGSVVHSSGPPSIAGGWNVIHRCTGKDPSDGSGIDISQTGYGSGIYLVGVSMHWTNIVGSVQAVYFNLRTEDSSGIKFDITIPTQYIVSTKPSSRGEEFTNIVMPVQFSGSVDGSALRLTVEVIGGTSITVNSARSRMWIYKIRDTGNA